MYNYFIQQRSVCEAVIAKMGKVSKNRCSPPGKICKPGEMRRYLDFRPRLCLAFTSNAQQSLRDHTCLNAVQATVQPHHLQRPLFTLPKLLFLFQNAGTEKKKTQIRNYVGYGIRQSPESKCGFRLTYKLGII